MLAEGYSDEDDVTPDAFVSVAECTELGVPATSIWQWASRGLVINGVRRKLISRALDAAGKPLYFRRDVVQFRDHRRVALASKVSGCQGGFRQKSAVSQPGPRSRASGLSCVQGREVAITDQTPEPPPEIVIPVRLDFTQAEKELGEFSQHVTSTLAAAVATGLGVHSLTVAMVAPAEHDL